MGVSDSVFQDNYIREIGVVRKRNGQGIVIRVRDGKISFLWRCKSILEINDMQEFIFKFNKCTK